ncbi:sulfur carrier protein ThiS [Salipiger abyssi]|uniref:Sulfur carrier protein n=1 Tax=Salipiger abyssi TaxID=1250539 RepID=A0A1P8ULV8_9RHOB|nr:sulfur carrier protein ThiS [Salipiger abyssi]APZ50381.1 sulfur carrier protein [Salipiger abyssi]
MRIELNGEPVETLAETLEALIDERGVEAEAVATAVGGSFVPRSARAATALQPGAKVEILAPMQGG